MNSDSNEITDKGTEHLSKGNFITLNWISIGICIEIKIIML